MTRGSIISNRECNFPPLSILSDHHHRHGRICCPGRDSLGRPTCLLQCNNTRNSWLWATGLNSRAASDLSQEFRSALGRPTSSCHMTVILPVVNLLWTRESPARDHCLSYNWATGLSNWVEHHALSIDSCLLLSILVNDDLLDDSWKQRLKV